MIQRVIEMATSLHSICGLLFYLFGICLIHIQPLHSQYVPICGAPGYNLANLTARIWQFEIVDMPGACLQTSNTTGNSCRFYLAFCRNLDKVMFFNCSDASVCQENLDDLNAVFKLGGYEQNPFKIDTEYNPNGFIVDFPNGQTYQRPNGSACTLSVRLDFICHDNAFWEVPPLETMPGHVPGPTPVIFNDSSCQFEVLMNYAGACYVLTPLETTGLSAGSILVIIFFVCLTVYCVFGTGINCARGSRGKEAVPNSSFWADIPLYIADGVVFLLQGCKLPGGGTKEYENI